MGIHGLSKLLADQAPKCISESPIGSYFGRKVAIDASMSIYQFLIAVRSEGNVLMSELGETTSHLMGMFYRTIRMIENGIKPVYVFDGKPPELKSHELKKRTEKRSNATEDLQEATETGTADDVQRYSKRLVKVTKEHNDDCKRLLHLMGIPYVESPSEAEAQCAAMAKAGLVYGAASEDMDTLTFGSPILLRHLTYSEARKLPISQIDLDSALKGLQLSMSQFIDLCILLGCDYCPSVKGIGPKKAFNLIREHGSLDQIVGELENLGFKAPEEWAYKEAKGLFENPEVLDCSTLELKWNPPDEEGLVQFLVKEKNFSEERVRSNVKKIIQSKGKGNQGRLDAFVTIQKPDSTTATKSNASSGSKSNGKKAKRGKK